MTLCLLQTLGRGWRYWGKMPESPAEKALVALLTAVGILFAVLMARPLLAQIRRLPKPTGAASRGQFLESRALRGRDLRGVDLTNARLRYADMSDTDLRGVDLTGADLEGAFLTNALYDANTRWPDGFNPRKRGARLVE